MQGQQGADPGTTQDDEMAATLGYITTLSQHVMGAGAPQEAESAPQEEAAPEPKEDLKPEIDALRGEFESLKGEVQKTIKDEIGSLTDMIKEALTDDEQKQD